jgi:hypothetical protein
MFLYPTVLYVLNMHRNDRVEFYEVKLVLMVSLSPMQIPSKYASLLVLMPTRPTHS